eukprot:1938645-Ditylum_brightwellii.AAC.1
MESCQRIVVIVKLPSGCPVSKPGTYWKLDKTLLWSEKFTSPLVQSNLLMLLSNRTAILSQCTMYLPWHHDP